MNLSPLKQTVAANFQAKSPLTEHTVSVQLNQCAQA